jgi:hypothetical protein
VALRKHCVTIRLTACWHQMADSETQVLDEKVAVQEQLSDTEIWRLCKERAAELNVPAWQLAESFTWH